MGKVISQTDWGRKRHTFHTLNTVRMLAVGEHTTDYIWQLFLVRDFRDLILILFIGMQHSVLLVSCGYRFGFQVDISLQAKNVDGLSAYILKS